MVIRETLHEIILPFYGQNTCLAIMINYDKTRSNGYQKLEVTLSLQNYISMFSEVEPTQLYETSGRKSFNLDEKMLVNG